MQKREQRLTALLLGCLALVSLDNFSIRMF